MLDNYQRIMVIGPSSSGKSTLAAKISASKKLPLLHLDQIAHKPNTNWERTPIDEFVKKHDKFVQQDSWIVEGNYSVCMPQRLNKAEVVIWCDPSLFGCIWRYLKRSWKNEKGRVGQLENAQSEFSWALILYTLKNYPKNRLKYQEFISAYPHLKIFHLRKFSKIKELGNNS